MHRIITPLLASIITLLVLFSLINIRTSNCYSAMANTAGTSTRYRGDSVRVATGLNATLNLNVFAFGYFKPTAGTTANDHYIFLSGYRLRPGAGLPQNTNGVVFENGFINAGGLGAVLIPVSRSAYNSIMIFCWMVSLMLLVLIIYAIAIKGSQLITRIARGDSFNENNFKALYLVGWTLLGVGLFPFVSNLVARLILGNRIPAEVQYNWLDNISRWQGWILAGLAVLLLAGAFRKAYQLQKENSLIV